MSRTFHLPGNTLALLQNGTHYFPQLCADIDAAQHSIYLETYIFAADETGRMVSRALQRAAARHVAVHLLLDGFGSSGLPQAWVDELRMSGVEVQWFRPERGVLRLRRHRLRRLHRKLACIDGEIAYVGGINIVNDIPDEQDFDRPRLDYGVRVQGRVAHEVQEAMHHLWATLRWASLRRRVSSLRERLHRTEKHAAAVQLLLRDNLGHRRDIERAYLQAIAMAQHEIVIANAYFLPGRAFRQALKEAAQREVRVVLLLQGRVEYRLQHFATLALYGQLLKAGVEIHEYSDSYLHAKVGVVDGAWATVGSSNLDPFSLLLAREANLVVRDAAFAAALRRSLWYEISAHARRIEPAHWQALPLWQRLALKLAYGLVRALLGITGYARQRHDF